MFIGGYFIANNSTDTDKEELSPFEKCLAHNDITFDSSKLISLYEELDNDFVAKAIEEYRTTGSFGNYETEELLEFQQDMKSYMQESEDTCGYLRG
jgi:hypothetical protein